MLSTLCWQFGRLNNECSCIEESIEREMQKASLYFILQCFVPKKIHSNNSKTWRHFCSTHIVVTLSQQNNSLIISTFVSVNVSHNTATLTVKTYFFLTLTWDQHIFLVFFWAAQQLLKPNCISRSAQIVSRLQTELETSKHFTPDFTSQVNFPGPCQDPCSYVVAHTQLYTHTDWPSSPRSERAGVTMWTIRLT